MIVVLSHYVLGVIYYVAIDNQNTADQLILLECSLALRVLEDEFFYLVFTSSLYRNYDSSVCI